MSVTKVTDILPARDTHANRPAATAVAKGTKYSCSDHNLIYHSDGAVWTTWATLAGGAITAASVSYAGSTDLSSTDVEAALDELDAEKAALSHAHAAADVTSGTLAAARLGSGSGGSSKFLREDSTWQTVSAGSDSTKVDKATLDANTILYATVDDTPAALAVAASRIVGRKASGDIGALTAAELWAILAGGAGHPEVIMVAISDETTAITTGTAKVTFRMPFAFTLTKVKASLTTASTSGNPAVNLKEAGTTVFSTTLTIDANELTSETAATAAVISDPNLADDAQMTIDIDTAGTGAKGLKVYLIGTRA